MLLVASPPVDGQQGEIPCQEGRASGLEASGGFSSYGARSSIGVCLSKYMCCCVAKSNVSEAPQASW